MENLIYNVKLKIFIVVRAKRKCSLHVKRTIRASIPTIIFFFKLIITRVPCPEPKAFIDKGGTLTLSIQIPCPIWYWITKQIVWLILICLKVDLFIGCHLQGVNPQSRLVCIPICLCVILWLESSTYQVSNGESYFNLLIRLPGLFKTKSHQR